MQYTNNSIDFTDVLINLGFSFMTLHIILQMGHGVQWNLQIMDTLSFCPL